MVVARQRSVLRLPTNCVKTEKGKSIVQIVTNTVVDGKKAEKLETRAVTIGLIGDEFVEIKSGVKEGERVRPNPYTGPPRKTIDVDLGDSKGNNG